MPAGTSTKEIEEEATRRWHALDAEQQRPYIEKFEQEQKRYQVDVASEPKPTW